MRPARSQCMPYASATEALRPLWDAWARAGVALTAARKAYNDAASAQNIALCYRCSKPMPDYDVSSECDGCHLEWGWSTPEGRAKRERAELDAQIASLQARRAKL